MKHRTNVVRRGFFTRLCLCLVCLSAWIGLSRPPRADPDLHEELGNGWVGRSSFDKGSFQICSVDKIVAAPGMGLGLTFFASRDSDLSLDLYMGSWNFFPSERVRDIGVRVDKTSLQLVVDSAEHGTANLWLTDIPTGLNEISAGNEITLSWRGKDVSAALDGSRAAVRFIMRCIRDHGSAELKAKLGIAASPSPAAR